MKESQLKGEICFQQKPFFLNHSKINIRLEDTSFADEHSILVCEQILSGLSNKITENGKILFELYVDAVDSTKRYAVNVHVDINGNDKIDSGDYINTISYPVLGINWVGPS